MCLLVFAFPVGTSESDYAVPEDRIPDQVVVRFHKEVPSEYEDSFSKYGDIIQHVPNLRFITLLVDPEEAEDIREEIETRDDVLETYHPGKVHALYTPNDPLLGQQWGVPAVGMEAAWDMTRGSHTAKVAVLDTGTMYGHEDLTPNTSQGDATCGPDYNVFTGSSNAEDDHFHGTHVAGTVAGVVDNGVGVSGMGNSCVMTVKVLNSWGSGTWEGVAEGIDFATQNGAHIISMSLGGGGGSPTLETAVNNANLAGVLVIAAAGNSYCFGGNTVLYPAKYDSVMAVAALQAPGNTAAAFSSCGPEVEISAPGANVISARIGGGYWYLSGTSMATPHVSGIAGLMKAANPLITGNQMRCIMNTSADDLGDPGRDSRYGWGRVNAEQAVLRATLGPLDPCFAVGLLPVPIPTLPL